MPRKKKEEEQQAKEKETAKSIARPGTTSSKRLFGQSAPKPEPKPADAKEHEPRQVKAKRPKEEPAKRDRPEKDSPKRGGRKSAATKQDQEPKRQTPLRGRNKRMPEPNIVAPEGAEDVMARLTWRPTQEATEPASSDEAETKFAARKSKSRPPKEPADGRKSAAVREEPPEEKPKRAPRKAVAKQKPPEPDAAKREHIAIPDDAAQVIVHEGLPSIVHKMRIIPPISFCASIPTADRMETVLEEVRMAAGNGIHMFTLVTDLTVHSGGTKSALDQISGQMAKLSKVDPDMVFIVRLNFVAPAGWEKKYRHAAYQTKSGEVAKPSVCDDEFWSDAENCMADLISSLRKSDKADVVLGVHLDRSEWFFPDGATYDSSDSAQEKFRRWVEHRYRDDIVSLRAAWFDGAVTFDSVRIPQPDTSRAGEEFVRTGRKARRWVDYNLFLSDATVDRIAKLAYAAKKASKGWYMVGVSYGYTFEWSHPANGHLSLGKLLRCPDIDYVAGPPSYRNREPGGSAPFPGPIDSFALNGKLYVSEDDFKTSFSGAGTEPDGHNPVMKTPQNLESAHWRSAGAALAHRAGVAWTDSWGNGWLNSAGIWERASGIQRTMAQRYAVPQGETDVAVLIDERSLAYLVDERAFEVLVQNVRESVLRSGQSAGFYVLSDLAHRENFPEAKLYVFLNAWDIRPEVRSAIKTRLQRDNKVLFWLYCAGLYEAGREALERVREVTGIALKPQPFHSKTGTSILNSRHPLCAALPEDQMAAGGQLEPSYFAVPEDGMVLGEYAHTGLPSFVVREFAADGDSEHAWTSVFLGEPVVTPGLFRALGQMAGAHVWNFDDDVMHIRWPFLSLHCNGAGQRTITLPNNWSAYSVTGSEWPTVEANTIRFNSIDGATHVFLIGLKNDIEAMLNADIDGLLKIDKLDPRVENTVHWDAVQFDVQIMKLDEWVEETWSEQLADDLLLKPSMLNIDADAEDEPHEPQPRGRRRGPQRRRRGRGRGRGPEETADARREGADKVFDEAGIGVLFRKKE